MRWRDWWSAGLVALATAAGVFAVGGAQTWAQVLVAALAALGLVPLIRSRRVLAKRSPLLLLALAAVGLTALQLVPLPHGLVSFLAPIETSLRDDGAELIGTHVSSTLSFDVPNTVHELLFFLTILAVAIVAVRFSATQVGRYRTLGFVAALCGVTAIVVGIHSIVGARELYGIFLPRDASPPLLGPLINTNHLGCLMAIGAVVSYGLVVYPRQENWLRALWLLAGLACTWCTLATMSRGATAALLIGMFVMGATLAAQRWFNGPAELPRRRSTFLTSSLPIGIVGACAIVVVVYAGSNGVSQQFAQTKMSELGKPTSKFVAWKSSLELVDEAPWTGIGRGALQTVFTRVHPAAAVGTYKHLENEYLQAVVDWGIPGALLLGGLTFWLVIAAVRRWSEGPLAACALGALAAVLLQSNVDFGVERLGVALPITLVVATLAQVPLAEITRRERAVVGARFAHIGALVAIGSLLVVSPTLTSVDDDHRRMDRDKLDLAETKEVAARHPVDYYSFARIAQLELEARNPDAIAVLNHALRLHPSHPGLHLVAARLLMNVGHPDQAVIEYATALTSLQSRAAVIEEIATRLDVHLAASALPQSPARIDEIARELDRVGRIELELEWLDRMIATTPELHRACELEYQLAASHPEVAVRVIRNAGCRKFEPTNEQRLAVANALGETHPQEVLTVLGDVESWQDSLEIKLPAWLKECDAQKALAKWDDARRCLHRVDGTPGLTTEQHILVTNRLEGVEEARRQ